MDEPQEKPVFNGGAMGLGSTILAATLIFTGGGYWLDQKTGGGVGFTLGGFGLAVAYIGYELWKLNLATTTGDTESEKDSGTSDT